MFLKKRLRQKRTNDILWLYWSTSLTITPMKLMTKTWRSIGSIYPHDVKAHAYQCNTFKNTHEHQIWEKNWYFHCSVVFLHLYHISSSLTDDTVHSNCFFKRVCRHCFVVMIGSRSGILFMWIEVYEVRWLSLHSIVSRLLKGNFGSLMKVWFRKRFSKEVIVIDLNSEWSIR